MKEWLRLSRPSPHPSSTAALLLAFWMVRRTWRFWRRSQRKRNIKCSFFNHWASDWRTKKRLTLCCSNFHLKKRRWRGHKAFSLSPSNRLSAKMWRVWHESSSLLAPHKEQRCLFQVSHFLYRFFLLLFIISLSFFPSVLFLFDSRNVHCLHPSTELDASFCCCFFR